MPGTRLTHAASFSLRMLSASFFPAYDIILLKKEKKRKYSTGCYDIQQQFDIVLVKIKVALILSDVLIKVQIVDFYPVSNV